MKAYDIDGFELHVNDLVQLVHGAPLHLSKYLTKGKVLRVDKFYCDREQVVVYLKSVPGKIHFEVGFYGHELRKIEEVK